MTGTPSRQILQTHNLLISVHLEDLFKIFEVHLVFTLNQGFQPPQRLDSQGFHTSIDCVGHEIVVLVLCECLVSRNVSPLRYAWWRRALALWICNNKKQSSDEASPQSASSQCTHLCRTCTSCSSSFSSSSFSLSFWIRLASAFLLTSFGGRSSSAASARVRKLLGSAENGTRIGWVMVRIAQVVVHGVVIDPVLHRSHTRSIAAKVVELFRSQRD